VQKLTGPTQLLFAVAEGDVAHPASAIEVSITSELNARKMRFVEVFISDDLSLAILTPLVSVVARTRITFRAIRFHR
jgi:hypothetical protein